MPSIDTSSTSSSASTSGGGAEPATGPSTEAAATSTSASTGGGGAEPASGSRSEPTESRVTSSTGAVSVAVSAMEGLLDSRVAIDVYRTIGYYTAIVKCPASEPSGARG